MPLNSQVCNNFIRCLTIHSALKVLRTLTFFIASAGLMIYIRNIFIKWIFNPDIMTTEKLIQSMRIPLPAMTICSPLIARIQKGNFAELTELS